MYQSTVNQGREVHGELSEATATTGRVPLRRQDDNEAVTVGTDEYLALAMVAIHSAAAGEVVLFFDEEDAGAPSAADGSVVFRGDMAAGERVVLPWETIGNGRRGRLGEALYLTTPGTEAVNVIVDGLVRSTREKSGPVGTPTHDPQ